MDEVLIDEILNKKGITIIGHYFRYDKNITHKDIISQINLIVELHKALVRCNFSGLSGIKSTIGKEFESYKVQIKRLERHYDNVVKKPCPNDVDKLILGNGKIMLNKAKDSVNYIYEHDYLEVIRRSMNREELCLGKVHANNLRRNKDRIEIGVINDMTYNLVEEDVYSYIKKLQRLGFNIDVDELIKLFVHASHLSFNSFEYLRGLFSYPRDFFKLWEKYINIRRKSINEVDMKKSNIIDNEQDKFNENFRRNKTNEELLLEFEKSLKYESKNFIRY